MVEKVDVPDMETMFYWLCASAESEKPYTCGNFTTTHSYWGRAELRYEDKYCSKTFDDFGITILCCDDEEEYAWECAGILLERFEKWYGRQIHPAATISDVSCWEQAEQFVMELNHAEELVYENCCYCLYYGEEFWSLMERGHNYDVPMKRAGEIWDLAFYFMAEGCMGENPYTTSGTLRYVM